MTAVVSVVAIAFSLVILAGWLMLLAAPLFVATAGVAGTSAHLVAGLGRWARRAATDIREGILIIDGLADDRMLQQVRTDVGRVLQLAPAGTHPRACACVKAAADDSYVGVLRVYNNKGHYLLRSTSETIAGVAQSISSTLRQFTEFPAKVGSKRQSCAECIPANCPLKKLARLRAQSAAAA